MSHARFQAAVERLHGFINFERRPPSKYSDAEYSLERMRRLLAGLGNPHKPLAAIHLAGTDGKGSTAALIAHFLSSLGFRVGLNTSPHLEDIRERFRINGELMEEEEFIELLDHVLAHLPPEHEIPPSGHGFSTVFEIITAIAFLYFARTKVDYAVVEVGMGGRLDATNVLFPLAAVIMQLGIDHTQHLGHTLEAIAREKLGIVKPGLPVVVCPQLHISEAFVQREILERGGMPRLVSDLFRFRILERGRAGSRFEFHEPGNGNRHVWMHPMPGDHQVANACTALLTLACLPAFGDGLPWEALRQALLRFSVPGRFEVFYSQGAPAVVLDVAHTEQAAQVLLRTLDQCFLSEPRCFLIAQMKDKDSLHYLQKLLRPEDHVIFTEVENPRVRPCEELAELLTGELAHPRAQVESCADPVVALDRALDRRAEGGLLVTTGSIYLAGAIRARLRALGMSPEPPADRAG